MKGIYLFFLAFFIAQTHALAQFTITANVCSEANSVRLTGPWCDWHPFGGPEAVNNGNGTWTFYLDETPNDEVPFLLVVDGHIENLLTAGDFSCTPITDHYTYANRLWIPGHNDLSGITYGSCNSTCEDEEMKGCMDSNASNYNAMAVEAEFDYYGNSVCMYPSCDLIPDSEGCVFTNSYTSYNNSFISVYNCQLYGGIPCEKEPVEDVCTVSKKYMPQQYQGNTGTNMTVLFTDVIMSALHTTNHDAYIVASTSEGLVVGSVLVSGMTQIAMAVFGDDSTTPEIDGAIENTSISFQLVDGDRLYDVVLSEPVTYVSNGISFQTAEATLSINCGVYSGCTDASACNFDPQAQLEDNSCQYPGCTDDNSIEYYNQGYLAACDDGSCSVKVESLELTPEHFQLPLITGNSMTIGFDLPELSGVESGMIGAFYDLNGDGRINTETNHTEFGHSFSECVGLTDYSEDFFTIGLWGDDSSTEVIDGLTEGVTELIFALKTETGKVLAFNLVPEFTGYATNGILVATQLDFNVTTYGCTDPSFCNYDADADEDDGTCFGYYACSDENYVEYDSEAGCHDENLCVSTWQNAYNASQTQLNQISTENENLTMALQDCEENFEHSNAPIEIDLEPGWNMIGYTRRISQDVVATLAAVRENIMILKNNHAQVYWPEFGFNGIGDFVPGQGYQIKIHQGHNKFTYHETHGERIELTPTVPEWVIDMEVEKHPNDVRSLVKVVNMLGQEVDPKMQGEGEVLLYLYNDATVEKKVVK